MRLIYTLFFLLIIFPLWADTEILCFSQAEEENHPQRGVIHLATSGASHLQGTGTLSVEQLATEIYNLQSAGDNTVFLSFFSDLSAGGGVHTFSSQIGPLKSKSPKNEHEYYFQNFDPIEKKWLFGPTPNYSFQVAPAALAKGQVEALAIKIMGLQGGKKQMAFNKCTFVSKDYHTDILREVISDQKLSWQCGLKEVKDSEFMQSLQNCLQEKNTFFKFICNTNNNFTFENNHYPFGKNKKIFLSKKSIVKCAEFFNASDVEL